MTITGRATKMKLSDQPMSRNQAVGWKMRRSAHNMTIEPPNAPTASSTAATVIAQA